MSKRYISLAGDGQSQTLVDVEIAHSCVPLNLLWILGTVHPGASDSLSMTFTWEMSFFKQESMPKFSICIQMPIPDSLSLGADDWGPDVTCGTLPHSMRWNQWQYRCWQVKVIIVAQCWWQRRWTSVWWMNFILKSSKGACHVMYQEFPLLYSVSECYEWPCIDWVMWMNINLRHIIPWKLHKPCFMLVCREVHFTD